MGGGVRSSLRYVSPLSSTDTSRGQTIRTTAVSASHCRHRGRQSSSSARATDDVKRTTRPNRACTHATHMHQSRDATGHRRGYRRTRALLLGISLYASYPLHAPYLLSRDRERERMEKEETRGDGREVGRVSTKRIGRRTHDTRPLLSSVVGSTYRGRCGALTSRPGTTDAHTCTYICMRMRMCANARCIYTGDVAPRKCYRGAAAESSSGADTRRQLTRRCRRIVAVIRSRCRSWRKKATMSLLEFSIRCSYRRQCRHHRVGGTV